MDCVPNRARLMLKMFGLYAHACSCIMRAIERSIR